MMNSPLTYWGFIEKGWLNDIFWSKIGVPINKYQVKK